MINTLEALFIFGCQRSGTTAFLKSFENNDKVRVFNEVDDIIHKPSNKFDGHIRLRLLDFEELNKILVPSKINIVKPLVESQNAYQIIEQYTNSKFVWIFRWYEDVIRSMRTKWGDNVGVEFVKSIIIPEEYNWRSEKTNNIKKLFTLIDKNNNLSKDDYCALFWYSRNLHYFNQDLNYNENIALVSYYHLTEKIYDIQHVLDLLEVKLNIKSNFRKIEREERELNLNPIVIELCNTLYYRLDYVHHIQHKKYLTTNN